MIIPVAVRREAFRHAGVFDESLSSAEDWEMWLRLTAHGHRAAEAPGPLGLRRTHAEQMSSDVLRMADNVVVMLEHVLRDYPLGSADRALVEARLTRALRRRAVVAGEDPIRSPLYRVRRRLGRVRERLGIGEQWYATPPPAVSAAFPDLREA